MIRTTIAERTCAILAANQALTRRGIPPSPVDLITVARWILYGNQMQPEGATDGTEQRDPDRG